MLRSIADHVTAVVHNLCGLHITGRTVLVRMSDQHLKPCLIQVQNLGLVTLAFRIQDDTQNSSLVLPDKRLPPFSKPLDSVYPGTARRQAQ